MNKINIRKEIKISMLGIISGTLILTFGEMIVIPLPEKTSLLKENFPEEIYLTGGQLTSGNSPKHFNVNQLENIPGKNYVYTQNNSVVNTSIADVSENSASLSVNIQMHYITAEHDVKTLIKKYTYLPYQSIKVIDRKKIGSYGLLIHQDQLHLSSCITPQGSSMFNNGNFYQTYPAFQRLSDRLVFWLLGEKSLVENVCLWSHLSIPIDNSSPEQAYLTLEKVWFSWYEHWHSYLVTMVSKR